MLSLIAAAVLALIEFCAHGRLRPIEVEDLDGPASGWGTADEWPETPRGGAG